MKNQLIKCIQNCVIINRLAYLEEQCEWNPLIIAVKYFLLIIVTQTAASYFSSNMFSMLARQCKRVRNPTVRIYHMTGHCTVIDA